jgi:hypothetical protein
MSRLTSGVGASDLNLDVPRGDQLSFCSEDVIVFSAAGLLRYYQDVGGGR